MNALKTQKEEVLEPMDLTHIVNGKPGASMPKYDLFYNLISISLSWIKPMYTC